MDTNLDVPSVYSRYDDASDGTYENLDRFGQVKSKVWKTSSVLKDHYDYTHDDVGNRLTRFNAHSSAPATLDQTFTYDVAHRLKTYKESTTTDQTWTLDAWGNWETFKYNGNATTQTRTHNDANELGTISNWANPAPDDAAGNMTTIPDPSSPTSSLTLEYDAWNRLVEVTGTGQTVQYEYDGLHRRIVKTVGSDNFHFYYSLNWQVLEVRKNSSTDPQEQYVWHPYYIDALAVRYYDSNSDGDYLDTDEIHYPTQDANFNVTSLIDGSGNVDERYDYTPYGELQVYDGSFGTKASSSFDNPYTFTGRRFDDETGLYYYRYRYYHGQLGRFVIRDPVVYLGSQWNLYEYVNSMPLDRNDASGLRPGAAYQECVDGCFRTWEQDAASLWKCVEWCRKNMPKPHPLPDLEEFLRQQCETLQDPASRQKCLEEVTRLLGGFFEAEKRIDQRGGPTFFNFDKGILVCVPRFGLKPGANCTDCADIIDEQVGNLRGRFRCIRQERDSLYDHCWHVIVFDNEIIATVDMWQDNYDVWIKGDNGFGWKDGLRRGVSGYPKPKSLRQLRPRQLKHWSL